MVGSLRSWVVASCTAPVLAACQPAPTYGYQYQLAQQFGGGEEPEGANREARELLASARTVAFYPPDLCLNTETASAGKHNQKLVQANCGVLMSTLERAAERSGYEVLSWQNLRGSKRPIDYARESNVDVLFEINEFDLDNVSDSDVQRTLTFYKVDPAGAKSALQVPQTVAQRCAGYSATRDPILAAGLTGTIDIKTVSVTDGRDRWHYRKTLSQAIGRTYPEVGFPAKPKPNRGVIALGTVGLVSIVAGGTFALLEATTTNNPSTGEMKLDFGDVPTYLIVGGLLVAGAAVALAVTTDAYAPADEVLCLDQPQATVIAAPAVPAAGPLTSQVTISETTGNDPLVKERERIRDAMVADFIHVLTEVHSGTHPRAAAPPVVPVPAVASPPAASAPAQP